MEEASVERMKEKDVGWSSLTTRGEAEGARRSVKWISG